MYFASYWCKAGMKKELFQRHVCIMLYIRSCLPGARYMYLNFVLVDSKDGDQTEAKYCCSCNETVH